jgi:hypothetical protein
LEDFGKTPPRRLQELDEIAIRRAFHDNEEAFVNRDNIKEFDDKRMVDSVEDLRVKLVEIEVPNNTSRISCARYTVEVGPRERTRAPVNPGKVRYLSISSAQFGQTPRRG